jgi:hypothetical protein
MILAEAGIKWRNKAKMILLQTSKMIGLFLKVLA